ncbi:ABC transporter ATP-binding protein [Jatrophihabitans sp. YIM 134969]
MNAPLLEVRDLHVTIPGPSGDVHATDGVDLTLREGEVFGIVGETGSGKSVTSRALIGLRPTRATRVAGEVTIRPADDRAARNVVTMSDRELRALWRHEVALIPQNPMTSLNPVMRIGDQVAEALAAAGVPRGERRARTVDLLKKVGLPAAESRLDDFPHQFSGGMLQRTLIAIALARPLRLLVADEPTTALDVLIQDQILGLLLDLQRDLGMSLVLISHDLAVISQVCDRVAVMYAGQIVEQADTATLLSSPRHPYTRALIGALPSAVRRGERLRTVAGSPPSLLEAPATCRFADRCPLHESACDTWSTELIDLGSDHLSRCRRATETTVELSKQNRESVR